MQSKIGGKEITVSTALTGPALCGEEPTGGRRGLNAARRGRFHSFAAPYTASPSGGTDDATASISIRPANSRGIHKTFGSFGADGGSQEAFGTVLGSDSGNMGCSTTVVKYLVFFFNLVFARTPWDLNWADFEFTAMTAFVYLQREAGDWAVEIGAETIAGAGLLALGILLKLKNDDIQNFIPDKYHLGLPPILLIAIGSVIFVTAFFGCCGAIKESTCMLTTFAIILLTLLIVQIAIAAYAFLQVGDTADLRSSVTQVVDKSFNQYNSSKAVQEEFDFLQSFLHCCGVDGVHDWKWEGGKLPNSCCSSNKNCTVAATNAYKDGCGDKAYKWFKNGLDLLGILAVAIATIERCSICSVIEQMFTCLGVEMVFLPHSVPTPLKTVQFVPDF
ncbi:hypothetical protein GEV33_006485 [Tenebrio molitor]|uniref:Tetraspanin n=1 Tax=Tenebrio molitor TaxID=7067 RepID=A0A8J6LJV2_TENMO|nr:hypothetical protein GEV33_006485 [Tenebrio molitor]